MALTYQYPYGLKHEIVEALKEVFGSKDFPDANYRGIYIGLEYPLEPIHYPAIYVTYSEGPIQSVGIGHYENTTDDKGQLATIKHFRFNGNLNFNILALNTVDRDKLAAVLMNLLAFGNQIPEFSSFYAHLEDATYLQIEMNGDYITPTGEQIGQVPWNNPDQLIYGRQYQVALMGEFFSNPNTGEMIAINEVELYPYRPDQPQPF